MLARKPLQSLTVLYHLDGLRVLCIWKHTFAHFSVIGGLGGADISLDMMLGTIKKLDEVKNEPGQKETEWYMVE